VSEIQAAEIHLIAPGLQETEPGIWRNPDGIGTVSYPEDGNAFCYELEEGSYWFQHRNRCLEAAIRAYPPDGLLLDVGGGNGHVTIALRKAGIASVVLEPGGDGIRNAQQRGLSPLIHATLEEAKILAGSLPALGLFDVLEHIEDDTGLLKHAHSLLKPGGRLYLTTPAFGMLWSAADEDAGHHRRYKAEALIQKLTASGLPPEYHTYYFSLLLPPVLFMRSIPSRLGWRKRGGGLSRYHGELTQPNRRVNALVERTLAFEARGIARRKRYRLGSSLLVVARKS
jgi:SAM-dependent methyltransferase